MSSGMNTEECPQERIRLINSSGSIANYSVRPNTPKNTEVRWQIYITY